MKRVLSFAAEFYIWLLPVVSVPVLWLIKNTFGKTNFIIVVVFHLLMVACSLWLFVKSRTKPSNPNLDSRTQLTAILLIVGAALTFVSATTFVGTNPLYIVSHKFEHYWTSGGFFLSTIISFAGLTLLSSLLNPKGDTMPPKFGFLAMLVGVIMRLIHLSFRLTAMVWAANEVEKTGASLPFYEMSNTWIGFLYAIYMVLTYLGFAAYGSTFLQTRILPTWLGRTNIIFGLAAPSLFIAGIAAFGMPITIQLMPWLIGIFLIRFSNTHDKFASTNTQTAASPGR